MGGFSRIFMIWNLLLALVCVTHTETSEQACIENGWFDPDHVTCSCRDCSLGRWSQSQSYSDCTCS